MSDVCRNVMETLVASELERQAQCLSAEERDNLDRGAVMAYALNRLPVRYALAPEDRCKHRDRLSRRLSPLVREAVSWGIKAVCHHPRPVSTTLPNESPPETTLRELAALLECDNLTWDNLAATVEATLLRVESQRPHKGRSRLAS